MAAKVRPTPWPRAVSKKEYRDILTLGAIIHACMAIGLFTAGTGMTIWMAAKWPTGWQGSFACLPLMVALLMALLLVRSAQAHIERM